MSIVETDKMEDMKELNIIEIISMATDLKDDFEFDVKFVQAAMEEYIRRTGVIPKKVTAIPDAIWLIYNIIKEAKSPKDAFLEIHARFTKIW